MSVAGRLLWRNLIVFVIVMAALLLPVMLLPVFRLGEIRISGLSEISAPAIESSSGLIKDQHLLTGLGGSLTHLLQLRYAKAEARLMADHPKIRQAVVRMDFPGKIAVDIEERVEVAYLVVPDGCAVIDKEGVLMDILQQPPRDIPIIRGVTVTSMILGQPVRVDVPAALNSAITMMGAIIDADRDERTSQKLLPQIRTIMPVGGRKIFMTVILPSTGDELNVSAELGQDVSEDLLWLRFALEQGAFDGRGKGILDLTGSRRTFTPD